MKRWARVPGVEPSLEVSTEGEAQWVMCGGDRLDVALHTNVGGYVALGGRLNGERRTLLLHRLMLMAFAGISHLTPVVRHLNDNKQDNRLVNLAFGTHTDNARDAQMNGRVPHYYYMRELI